MGSPEAVGSFGSPEFTHCEFWEGGLAGSYEVFSTFDPGSVRFWFGLGSFLSRCNLLGWNGGSVRAGFGSAVLGDRKIGS